jgi:hypothetical protein
MKRKALAICLSLMVWPLLGAAPVAEIQAILAKPKVLCGRFDQTKLLAGLKNPLRSMGGSGSCRQRRLVAQRGRCQHYG